MKNTSSLLLFAFSVGLAGPAEARPPKASAQQITQAKAAFATAAAAYDAARYEDALREFERAHELSRNPVFFFNLAACAEKLGRTRVAAAYLRAYLTEVPRADDAEKVRERIGALEERAKHEDERKLEDDRRADEEARLRKEAEERKASAAALPPSADVSDTTARADKTPVGTRYAGGFAALGATAVLGIVAAGLGGSTLVKYNDLDASCGATGCGSRVDVVHSQAIAADVFLGLTGAAAITTVVLFALEARHHGGAR